uniref:Helitron helicase-like domain-containing protein n=1 Tax=Anopheles atroparvus TaxID=41427 RepID=A0A182IR48_ANOAO
MTAPIYHGQMKPALAGDNPGVASKAVHRTRSNVCFSTVLEDLAAGALDHEIARIHVTENQKRDLPHAHCLMVLADAEKPRSAADYGWLVLAKIPDRANEHLYETISETQYLDAQYISTSQAISTFFGYKMQAKR